MIIWLTMFLVILGLYCAGSVGIIWLMCELMNLPFNVPMAIGVWFVANLVIGIVRKGKKK